MNRALSFKLLGVACATGEKGTIHLGFEVPKTSNFERGKHFLEPFLSSRPLAFPFSYVPSVALGSCLSRFSRQSRLSRALR